MCPSLCDLLQVVITPGLIYGAAAGIVPFFSWANIAPVHIPVLRFHSSVDGVFASFHVLAIAIMLQCSFACLCLSNSVFLGHMPRSVPAESYGTSMCTC